MARKKRRKKSNKILTNLILVLCILLIIFFISYNKIPEFHQIVDNIVDYFSNDEITKGNSDDLSIHFINLETSKTGDSIYIKAGDVDILVDAGAEKGSSTVIKDYVDQYVTDNKFEYIIATHADQDHISAFVGTSTSPGIFDSYDCDLIIDFPRTNKTTKIYNDYKSKVEEKVKSGSKHYNALECYNNENGAKRTYELAEGIELEILYNYYYEHNSSDENNYSVCFIINQTTQDGIKHFLFTGDLEKKGEEYLVQYNDLPKVELFKAGHHGSKTSSNECLLEVIQPKIVCVCCCAGSTEYTDNKDNTFPTQDFISRILKYTDKVYVTTKCVNGNGYAPLNGTIIINSSKEKIDIACLDNNIILKDSQWFKDNRKWE